MVTLRQRLLSVLSVGALVVGIVGFGAGSALAAPVLPFITPGTGSVLEGNSGTTTLNVPVTLSHSSAVTVTAHWRTGFLPGAAGNQADPATDYTPTSGTVTFTPGMTTTSLPISVNGDTLDEPDEYILVQVGQASNGTTGGPAYGLGSGTILNDDKPTIVPGSGSVYEGPSGTTELDVPVTLSNPSTRTITASWATGFVTGASGNQADPATDYTPASGTVTFAPGDTSESVAITVSGDLTIEPDEYILVGFANPTNAKIGGIYGLGSGSILNDDGSATIVCPSDAPCASPPVTSTDGTASLQVTAGSSDNSQSLTVTTDGVGPMLCTLTDGGAIVEFHTTASDVEKIANFTVVGDAATFAESFFEAHTNISGCYGQADPWFGWSPSSTGTWADGPYVFGPAPFDEATGLYEAFLGNCGGTPGVNPCFVNINGVGFNTTQIHTPPSANDPRGSH
jgi:hypothetical protein